MKSLNPTASLGLVLALAACGGDASNSSGDDAPEVLASMTPTRTRVLAVNDLGMHCMDREYSVFSILPPFNVVHAQVVKPGPVNGKPIHLDPSLVDVRYSAMQDPTGSVNSTSIGKTDFWQHAQALFGAVLAPGQGLLGFYMPADAPNPGPQPMTWDAAHNWFSADGIPITPTDDGGGTNTYPLLRISAYDRATGVRLAATDVVVPVAQETDCSNCHATGALAASDPNVTWSSESDLEIQTKRNILLLHDHTEGTQLMAAQPVLCAGCHYSPALDLAGSGPVGNQVGHATMSFAMHNHHGKLLDGSGAPVFPPNGNAQQTCYQCHPGAITQCARGAMVNGGMECLDCHGDMLAVGGEHPLLAGGSIDGQNDFAPRRPWKDLPRCQSCHTGDAVNHLSGPNYVMAADGIRLKQAYRVNDPSASPISRPASRFAENANSLYRFSAGHGNVSCEMCHGSTHAEWPVQPLNANDNIAARELQGHTGALMECKACHTGAPPSVSLNGPHGMHPVADMRFIDDGHEDLYEQNESACKACHGANLLGSALGKTSRDRTFHVEGHTYFFPKGTQIRCDTCHELPD
ncbi:MAG: hypothetical protein IT454_01200 [Planctomycetes bacterium]|nr:hypothetical protein [Planctomycetota bacterium]